MWYSSTKRARRNYRPVSLTSVPRKVMEQITLSDITWHTRDNQVIRNRYMKGRSCLMNLISFYDKEDIPFSGWGKGCGCGYLYFCKAFDTASHRVLEKLAGTIIWYYLIRQYLINTCILKLSYRILFLKCLKIVRYWNSSDEALFHNIASHNWMKQCLTRFLNNILILITASIFQICWKTFTVSYFGWTSILLMRLIKNWFKTALKFNDRSENWMAVLQAPIICFISKILI